MLKVNLRPVFDDPALKFEVGTVYFHLPSGNLT